MQARIGFERADWPLSIKAQKQAVHVVRYRSTRTHARVSCERAIRHGTGLCVPLAHEDDRVGNDRLDVDAFVQLGRLVLAAVLQVVTQLRTASLL